MKTKAEIIASLPERFRGMDFRNRGVLVDPDDANWTAFYEWCRYQELLKAFKVLIEKYS